MRWVALALGLLQDGSWLPNLEEGKKASAQSGKPILLVTICAPKG